MTIHKTLISATLLAMAISIKAEEKPMPPDSTKVYQLGEINVVASKSTKNNAEKVTMLQLMEFNRENLTEAVNLMPGLTISESGGRNEGALYLRGFNMLQTPIYYDGIPIYVPYDGNVDISRFTTYDMAQINISKGFTSVLYGANTMGGAINIVSRKPDSALDIDGIAGTKFGKNGLGAYNASVNIGSKMEKFYVQASASYLENMFLSLSDKFEPTDAENGKRREQSATRDLKLSAKAGFTPNETDEYSVSVSWQKASKDISPSIKGGTYRDYPDYNKKSVYFKSSTKTGESTSLALTAYYDNYYNVMNQYDDNTYTLQNTKKAFNSIYDDFSAGGSAVIENTSIAGNTLRVAFHEKYDSHKEHNGSIAANESTGQVQVDGEPVQEYLDNTISVGVEDAYDFSKSFRLVAGASYNYRSNKQAQEYGSHFETGEANVLFDFPTGSDDAFNYQLAAIFKPAGGHEITASASRKSRFASQKDRYSYRLGSQEPNPDLKSEFSWIFDLTFEGEFNNKFQYQVSLFRNEIDDAIYAVTVGTQDNGDPLYRNVNFGKAVFQGYEVSLGYSASRLFSIGGNYSYIHRENKDDKRVKYTGVPDHKFVGYFKYKPTGANTYLHADMESNSSRYVTSDGTTLPGYTIFNARIHVQLAKGVALEAGARNITDKNYFISLNYPKEGRTFFTNIVYNF